MYDVIMSSSTSQYRNVHQLHIYTFSHIKTSSNTYFILHIAVYIHQPAHIILLLAHVFNPFLSESIHRDILGECLLISSLQGRALRTLVDIARLAERFNMRLKAEPGKLVIKRQELGILFISLPIVSLVKLVIMT